MHWGAAGGQGQGKRRREEGAVGYVRRFRRTEQENEEAAKEVSA